MKNSSISFLVAISITLFGCKNGNLEFHLSSTKEVDEIDTIWQHPDKNICFLGFVRYGALGRFTHDLAIVKSESDVQKKTVCYEMQNGKKRWRVTKEYIVLLGDRDRDTIGKWNKDHILETIDSVSFLMQPPKKLYFKATD